MLVDPTTENGYRGLWNLQGAFTAIAGIAYAGHDSTYNYFYMLSASGTIHLIGIAPSGDGYTLSLLHTIGNGQVPCYYGPAYVSVPVL